ncbi:general transcription factor II-I repeat domain-containing protein 2-like [Eriocheir sinensis]|uniref:general transcription factor II-I repeat domain-containing protein 2-like n=1 Tax=Eriocheir sinensis TaxID=95602 RepID=UPI0021C952B7|nr:general transcription factor II-I repeat domain-containing protein 2-like [Eriocheir sinensis]
MPRNHPDGGWRDAQSFKWRPNNGARVTERAHAPFHSQWHRRTLAADFKLFTAPFDFPVDDAPAHLQMELVELQCNDELKAKFRTSSPLSFFRDLVLPSSNFPKYIGRVQRIVATFGSTYCCEQLFSKMKYTKSHLRSQLSDLHLNDILLLSTLSIEPDIETLIHGKQHQPSH